MNDAARVWNNAPSVLKDCKTLSSAKKKTDKNLHSNFTSIKFDSFTFLPLFSFIKVLHLREINIYYYYYYLPLVAKW